MIDVALMTYCYSLTRDFDWQLKSDWQVPDTPFMSFAFWQALSDSGAIGEEAGWLLIFVEVHQSQAPELPVAVMPVFIKGHHRGEFVFDHAWAEAYARYGVDYYPRLVTSVPFTPITGQRLWLTAGTELTADILAAALSGVENIAAQVNASSWHGLFVTEQLAMCAQRLNSSEHAAERHPKDHLGHDIKLNSAINSKLPLTFLPQLFERQGCQFLWQNQNLMNDSKPFANFDEFLMTLTAKRRRTISSERKKVAKQNIRCELKTGTEITAADWSAFYECYVMTYAVRGQEPYLNADFFTQLGRTMSEHLMLAQALDDTGAIIASSLFVYDEPNSLNSTLYGRYWGALDDYDSLHFELCYYQGIEFAIEKGLDYFDPGTQGEHKLIRGFVPTVTHSLHRIYDPRFAPAIGDFCQRDIEHMRHYRQQAHEALPFNADNMPTFKG